MSKVVKGALLAGAIILTGGAAVYLAPGVFATMGFYAAVTSLATGAFLSGVSAQLASRKSPRYTVDVEYSGTVEPRRILYGFNRVSGMHTIPPLTTGTNNKFLHKVLTLAGHQINAITAVYFNQEAVGTLTSITGSANDGKVTTGTFANKAWVRGYLGTSGQTADFILDNALTGWTSNHRGRGVAYVATQKELDDTVWKQGETTDTFDTEGKLCYDPRLDTSPGANPTNATYYAYTRNATLQRADFIIDATLGLGEDPARVDWDMVVTAADIDDEAVAVPTASTQPRYRGDLALFATDPYEDNILTLTACNLGSTLYSGPKWRIRSGAWETPTFEITDSNVMGPIEVETAYPYKDRWNSVRGSFRDPASNYQANEFPPISVASYVSADGATIYKDVALDCINVYEAQRRAIYIARKSRNAEVLTVPCDLSLWKVRPGDTGLVNLTELGMVNEQVRCESWAFTPDGLVALRLRVEAASDWDDPLEADYLTPSAVSTPTPSYFTPDAPSALAAQTAKGGIALSWTAPALVPVGSLYEVWMHTASTPFASASKVWTGAATNAFIPRSSSATVYFWVRLVMPDGTAGSEHPTSAAGVSGYPTVFTLTSTGPSTGTNQVGGGFPISVGGAYTTYDTIASTSWANSTGHSVDVEITYTVLGRMQAADTLGSHCIVGGYDTGGGTTYDDSSGDAAVRMNTSDFVTKSGTFVVSVSAGATVTASIFEKLYWPLGGNATPPVIDYVGASIRISADM